MAVRKKRVAAPVRGFEVLTIVRIPDEAARLVTDECEALGISPPEYLQRVVDAWARSLGKGEVLR